MTLFRRTDKDARIALLACFVGYAIDGYDFLVFGFLLPDVGRELHFGKTEIGALVSATLGSALIGGLLFGALADRIGRVRTLGWTIALFAGASGLCAFARNFWELMDLRIISGLGLGGEFGVGMALASEVWPFQRRARATSYVALGWQAGAIAAAATAPVLLRVIGWRGAFLATIIPGVLALFLRLRARESEAFRTANSARSTWRPSILLESLRRNKRSAAVVLAMCSIQNFGYYGLIIWLPNHISTYLGFSLSGSLLWSSSTIAGMIVGILCFGEIADRVGRKPAFVGFQLASAAMVVIYTSLRSPSALLIGGAALGFFVNGALGGFGALIAELYPVEGRAMAENVIFNAARALGGIGPFVFGLLETHLGASSPYILLCMLYAIDSVMTAWLLPETLVRIEAKT